MTIRHLAAIFTVLILTLGGCANQNEDLHLEDIYGSVALGATSTFNPSLDHTWYGETPFAYEVDGALMDMDWYRLRASVDHGVGEEGSSSAIWFGGTIQVDDTEVSGDNVALAITRVEAVGLTYSGQPDMVIITFGGIKPNGKFGGIFTCSAEDGSTQAECYAPSPSGGPATGSPIVTMEADFNRRLRVN